MNDVCTNPDCGKPITVSVFRGSGHCSENCRKAIEAAKEEPERCQWPSGCNDEPRMCGFCGPHCEWQNLQRLKEEGKL